MERSRTSAAEPGRGGPAPLSAEIGFYGKVPTHGDFVASRVDRAIRDPLDTWVQRSLGHGRRQIGQDWPRLFAQMPPWRFVLGAGLVGGDPVIGVMVPSTDRVGRAFPLFLTARVRGHRGSARSLSRRTRWFEAAEALLATTRSEAFHLDRFDGAVARLILDAADEEDDPRAARESDRSFWWTEALRVSGRRFAAFGFPAAEEFVRLLGLGDVDGRDEAEPRAAGPQRLSPQRRPPIIKATALSHAGTRLRTDMTALSDLSRGDVFGMAVPQGDAPAGAAAARIVVDRLSRADPALRLADLIANVKGALGTANTLIRNAPVSGPAPIVGMAALLVAENSFAVVWAGDLRVYLLRDGMMRCLTRDHVEIGLSRRLTRSVGGQPQFACDLVSDPLQANDRFLVASGSLTRILSEREVATVLLRSPAEEGARALVDEALVAGVPENVAVLAVDAVG